MRTVLAHTAKRQNDPEEVKSERYALARQMYLLHFKDPTERLWPSAYSVRTMPHTVFVSTLLGRNFTVRNLPDKATVLQLKSKIREMEGAPEEQQNLSYAGVQLEDQKTLFESGVHHEATVFLRLRLRGC